MANEMQFRVMYPDTDQMGTVHHSHYARYYETARWELFRQLGINYRSVEEAGYLLPVTRMRFRFLKTARYDDLLKAETRVKHIKGARIGFTCRIFNCLNELVNEAEIEVACVSRNSWKPCALPEFLASALRPYIQAEIQAG